MGANISISQDYVSEMNNINTSINSYKGYEEIAESLSKFVPQPIVAGLIGCIIPESGTNHRVLNAREYRGNGVSGTEGWNCGEGLVQWTYWKYKEPLIRKYNADSRSTQKLPTDWETYKQGTPKQVGNALWAESDGKHIAGLTLDNQMLFLTIYYEKLINQLKDETDVSVITAKIYQQKAGNGFYTDISDPVERAYTTSANKYKSSSVNHFLKSLKLAMEYDGSTVTYEIPGDYYYANNGTSSTPQQSGSSGSYSSSVSSTPVTEKSSNIVTRLASATKPKENVLKLPENRQNEFAALQTAMASNTPELGREIMLTSEMFDPNILKGDQEAKHEIFEETTKSS